MLTLALLVLGRWQARGFQEDRLPLINIFL